MVDEPDHISKKGIEYTMGFGKVNLITLLMIVPLALLIVVPYFMLWDYATFAKGKEVFLDYILLFLLGGVIAHELLHGITWSFFTSVGMKSIKFGVNWKYLAPYCHCSEPLKVKRYKIGVAMPLIVLGIIPALMALLTGNGTLLIFGFIFSLAAGGDIISLFLLRKLDKNSYVSDHPDKMGFIREIG